tara:strand:+ start:2517 stop:3386 length:870 start_codon:yes stop_codon:yes gene_type:complete
MSQEQIGTQESNPLKKYYRQPKQFVRLPSNYKYYKPGTIQIPESGEVAVFPMTAKDELLFKTPDALLNGEATVRVIQSCIPAITNAWEMPALDIDTCLVAIRMATYGTKMQVKVFVPKTKIEKDMELDLQAALDRLLSNTYEEQFLYQNMEVTTRPLTYKEFTEAAIKTFEEQRLATVVQDKDMPEEEKIKRFQASFSKLTDINIQMVSASVASIRVDGQTVTDKTQIQEFLENTSKEFYQTIIDQSTKQKDNFTIPPVEMTATPEEIKAGAPETYKVPVLFDQANFFA